MIAKRVIRDDRGGARDGDSRERRRDPDESAGHQCSSSRSAATTGSSSVRPVARSSAPSRASCPALRRVHKLGHVAPDHVPCLGLPDHSFEDSMHFLQAGRSQVGCRGRPAADGAALRPRFRRYRRGNAWCARRPAREEMPGTSARWPRPVRLFLSAVLAGATDRRSLRAADEEAQGAGLPPARPPRPGGGLGGGGTGPDSAYRMI